MPSPIAKESEPIPGYRIKEFLGAGGYGEVWSAAAPGGLTKAIKLVFGRHSEKRAAAELKSLERIRELRHPFLLSLERYEVVDGRLVIVTELADCSLRERFSACREEGLLGIPRDELLHYLREAADGLDFMLNRGLQHLDVKPANLLILADHVKIADFGLVKDLQNISVTLIGGLTPVYSAPELFRGRPNDRSDQYSLAVVFQEMLTGTLPFPAGTPAELALRQANAKPDVSSLGAADRPVIARALSKDPVKRFGTCVELVEALLGRNSRSSSARGNGADRRARTATSATPKSGLNGASTPVHTVVCHPESILPAVDTDHELMNALPRLQHSDRTLDPIKLPKAKPEVAPTLICGIGGTAAHVLRHLCRRVNDRFGDRAAIPALKMLLIDTDPECLLASTTGDDRSALRRDETLAVPLRRPQQYRQSAQRMLRWLKRRWLYNVPRSLKTEGLRPLGRLAMADHAQALFEAIERAARAAADPQAIEVSSRRCEEPFRTNALRIYLIASVAGGTGSGIVLDAAYALQSILQRLNVDKKEVYGILVHSTAKNVPLRDLAVLNTLSWLTEYNHFNRPGGVYPGDETCGLAPVEPGTRAFDRVYLSHLGDDLDNDAFCEATRSVADYVYLDVLTPASAFFTACRDEPDEAPELLARHAKLRTFGLQTISCMPDEVVERVAVGLCRAVLLQRSGRHAPETAEPQDADAIEQEALNAMEAEQLDERGIYESVRALVERASSADGPECRDELYCNGANRLDDSLATLEPQCAGPAHSIPAERLEDIARQVTTDCFDKTKRWLIAQIDEQHVSLAHAARAAGAVALMWRAAMQDARSQAKRLEQHREELPAETASKPRTRATAPVDQTASPGPNSIQDEAAFQLERSTRRCALRVMENLRVEIDGFAERLTQLSWDLERLALMHGDNLGETPSNGRQRSERLGQLAHAVTRMLGRVEDRLASELSEAFNEKLITQAGGWFALLTDHHHVRSDTLSGMKRLARQIVRRAVNQTNLLGRLFTAGENAKSPVQLEACLERAVPRLSQHAGPQRLLAVLPADLTTSGNMPDVLQALNDKASLTNDAANELTLCYEANWLSLPHFAAALIKHSPRRAEEVGRLHARCDVDWSSVWKGNWPIRAVKVPDLEPTGSTRQNPEPLDS